MKFIRILITSVLLLTMATTSVFALEEDSLKQTQEELTKELETSIAGDLDGNIPDSAKELLGQNGLDGFDAEMISNFQFLDILTGAFELCTDYFTAPFRLFTVLMGIFLLIALLNAVHPPETGMMTVQNIVGISALMLVLSSPVMECINYAVTAITECSQFLLSFIPVFTGVVAASGKPLSSMGYSAFLFGTVQVISQIAATILTPLLCIYLAICIVGALNPTLHLENVAETIKKAAIWIIGLLLTIFVALLSVQSLVSNSADNVATKTTKFFIGSLIPVFGSALSDVFNSVQGCVGFMKQATGSFGVVVSICTFLPIVIEILAMMLVVNLSQMVGNILGVDKLARLLKSVSSMLSLLLGLILCFAVMIILSTTIIMLLSMGG